jgi:hypothetical protein
MPLIPNRKDFVDLDTLCHRCATNGRSRILSSGTAFFLKHDDGTEHPYGPNCAGQALGDAERLKGVPDFTARDSVEGIGEELRGAANGRDRVVLRDPALRDIANAKRYLLLRMEKVANIPGINPTVRYQPLQKIYREYVITGVLGLADVTHILAIENNVLTPLLLKTNNLLDVYTAETKLTRRIKNCSNVNDIKFLESVRSWLRTKLYLSAKQINAAEIQLHSSAFVR